FRSSPSGTTPEGHDVREGRPHPSSELFHQGERTMRVGILGTGVVAHSLGTGFVTAGHGVKMGSRSATNDKAVGWAKAAGPKASTGTFEEAAKFGDVVLLCTLGSANESVIGLAKPESFADKVVIDTTNPLDSSDGTPRLAIVGNDSG